MSSNKRFCVKLIHCGNKNIADPLDNAQKNIFFMPIGFCALGSVLRENGFDVELIHSDLVDSERLLDTIDLSRVDAVGFDCHWANQSLVVMDAAELIKKINPDIFVFLGGYTSSLFCEEIITDYPQVDAVIRGDGEIPIVELCSALYESKLCSSSNKKGFTEKLGTVQNLAWRNEDGCVRLNNFSYIGTVEQIDRLDFAAIDLLRDWDHYRMLCKFWTRFDEINSGPLFFLCIGRGCQYACLFCGGNCEAQRRMNNRICASVRSIDSVVQTIKKAVSMGFTTMYTCFEFEGSEEWYIKLLERIKQEGLDINFIYGAWRLPSKALVDTLSECCSQVMVEISPETGDEELRKINKDIRLYYSNEQLEECLQHIKSRKNIKVQLYYGYFLVKDTEETIIDTLKYIMKLAVKYSDFVEQEYFNFSTDPGSLIFFYPEKYDIQMNVQNFKHYIEYIKENYLKNKESSADMRVFNPRNMSIQVVREVERKIRLFNYLFKTYRGTVSTILKRTCEPDIIVSLLNDNSLLDSPEEKLSPDEFKELLVNACSRNNCLDAELLKIISIECEKQKMNYEASRPAPQIWLEDVTEEGHEGSKTVDAMLDYINMEGKCLKEDMDLDFDFDLSSL
ncbi:MAG: B12-binding domain-containing radical SAM protein [Bacillota bacterium]